MQVTRFGVLALLATAGLTMFGAPPMFGAPAHGQEGSAVPPAAEQASAQRIPAEQAQNQEARPPQVLRPLAFNELLIVNAASREVTWQGNALHLVTIPTINFKLEGHHLTAASQATLLTFNKVPYQAHVAVFDAQGQLLGTAATSCATERVWLGIYMMTWQDITFDFGESQAFAQAAFFSLAITDHKVLTPDEWNKDQQPEIAGKTITEQAQQKGQEIEKELRRAFEEFQQRPRFQVPGYQIIPPLTVDPWSEGLPRVWQEKWQLDLKSLLRQQRDKN